jgi:nitrite reductase/ring-hydroxylating ferredoxin subunit
VQDAAPEVTEVVVEGMTAPPEPKLLQIGPRPDGVPGAGPPASAGGMAGGEWVTLPDIGPPSSRPVTATAAGLAVLVCSVRGTLYAYRDQCASCGSPMGGGTLDREVLTCTCGSRYDVCRAGAGLDGLAAHLDPLPLLTDSQGVRVAVPAAVPS